MFGLGALRVVVCGERVPRVSPETTLCGGSVELAMLSCHYSNTSRSLFANGYDLLFFFFVPNNTDTNLQNDYEYIIQL